MLDGNMYNLHKNHVEMKSIGRSLTLLRVKGSVKIQFKSKLIMVLRMLLNLHHDSSYEQSFFFSDNVS